ncbi:Transcription factor GRAS [Cynara cardunculus var. scolymus]|uniref:Transcription factor GRAS n=2 Tax=Cynara cardunculus var. scolymus TaxID=59895 RepID=A0A103XI66_CYNCS|nr:Transcription factor GRAS [Cynara cardunculus var. scolymus]
MPLPFEFERKGAVALRQPATAELVVPCANKVERFEDLGNKKRKYIEPKSVLDNINSSPSPPTSTSTLSSSLGGGGGGGGGETVGLVAVSGNPSLKWPPPENQETSSSNVGVFGTHQPLLLPKQSLDITAGGGCGDQKCSEMEDWESVLSESGQEQSILRWIMGDVEDPSMGLNKMLHGGGTADEEHNGGFGFVDQGYAGFDPGNPIGQIGNFYQVKEKTGFSSNPPPPPPSQAEMFGDHHHNHKLSDLQNPIFSQLNPSQIHPFDVKPQIFNPQSVINQNQSQSPQNPTFFLPLEQQLLMPPQPKRHNPGIIQSNFQIPKTPFLDSPPNPQNPLQLLQQKPSSIKKMSAIDELGQQQQQSIIDQLFKAADMIQSGNNPILAQGILARLNHQLSPIGKPFDRAAFYFKEALQLLVHSLVNNMNPQITPIGSPFSLIFKIGAYKSFSEISPFVQFANFTCNQALLEILDGYDQVHIIDFDLGYGDQWASLMQELALRTNTNGVSIKITAFASPTTHDHLELSLTRENLVNFANEINVGFDFEIVNIDVLASASWSLPFHVSDNEAIAVNLPTSAFSNYQILLPLVLRFVKDLAPKIVVSVDRGSERTDLPFPNHLIHALQSYSNLLESLDAVNMNLNVLQKIERFLIQPSIEKSITGRYSYPEKTQHWRAQFLSSGFSPLTFSNFTESQAVCMIKRTPVRGFHIERRQSSLVLCWQRRELVSASAWRC